MLEPSLAFYAALFGAIKAGAIAVPLFTLFGPDGLRLRIDDCKPQLLLTNGREGARWPRGIAGPRRSSIADDALLAALAQLSRHVRAGRRAADDLAVFQYTSGTTRELPEAVKHTHRAIVAGDDRRALRHRHPAGRPLLLPVVAGLGPRPLARHAGARSRLGVTIGAYAGTFDAERLLRALQDYRDHQSVGRRHPLPDDEERRHGGALSLRAREALLHRRADRQRHARPSSSATFGRPLCSMYGTTEVGVILVNYPGAADFAVKPTARSASRCRACASRCSDADGKPLRAGRDRRDQGLAARRAGSPPRTAAGSTRTAISIHAGRADDVIISAGWTMSAVEIEDALLKHPDVREAAAIGVPDALRGQVVKAFVVSPRAGRRRLRRARSRSSCARGCRQHEYPRQVAFVAELPKTPAGKVNRKVLREREAARRTSSHDMRSAMTPTTSTTRLFPKITDEALDDLRRRIGVPITDTLEPWCHEATRDNIRHYAHGIGDDNPLWCDPDYAAKTALRRHRRAAVVPVRQRPHHLGLRRRPARRARDVGRRRLDLASARAAQRRDHAPRRTSRT